MSTPGAPVPGQVLRMVRGNTPLIVDRQLAEGGQGLVYRATLSSGAAFAVKWFRPGPYTARQRRAIDALVTYGRPHPAFVWPIDLVECEGFAEFGYVMPLIEERFHSFAQMLTRPEQPSFAVMAVIGRQLADAFAALHGSGLCYRDISFGNLLVDPAQAEVVIVDNDNVGTDGGDVFVKGTLRFMAPEIVRGEALPSTATDLYSLAVFLFYLFVHGHPLEGVRTDSTYTWHEAGHRSESELATRHFGLEPLFVFDPDDDSNRPLPGDPMWTWWSLYPRFLQTLFIQAFTVGLRDASLSGRVTEGVWRRALLRLRDCVSVCRDCHAAVFYDADDPEHRCWRCNQAPPAPPLLSIPGHTIALVEGAVVTRHHLLRDRDHTTPVAVVEAHPRAPGQVVMRNLSEHPWTIVPTGEERRLVVPNQRMAVRAMAIDLGPVQGSIRTSSPAADPSVTSGEADPPA